MNIFGDKRFLYLVGAVIVVVLALVIWTRSGTVAPPAPAATSAPATPTTPAPAAPATPAPEAPAKQ